MRRSALILASVTAVVCLWTGPARAVQFIPPADGPVPFHRDQLPIDVNAMTTLSHQLVTLASAQNTREAPSLQTVARLLALAQALDPQNREAEDLSGRLKEKKSIDAADAKAVDRATSRAWQMESWLESDAAGADGKALAKCLLDVLAAVDPQNPKAESARASGLQGAWASWVAPAAEFEEKKLVKHDTPAPKGDEPPVVKPKNEGAKTEGVSIRLAQASVATPLWVVDPTSQSQKAILRPVPVKITASTDKPEADAPHRMLVHFQGDGSSDQRLHDMSVQVVDAVKSLRGGMPKDGKAEIVIANGCEYYYQINRNLISAAEAVLVDSMITGEVPSATVIGVVGPDGSFKAPPRFWELLRSLSSGPGGRLVIPRECAQVMLSVLAVEDPGFFFKYEVISASNLKELTDRAAKRSASPLDEASAKFLEVREKLGTSQVGAFVANRFVRQRLAEVAQAYPDHMSAKMLAIQGAGERPTKVPRTILAAELRKAVLPTFAYAGKSYDQIEVAPLEATYEECKKAVEALGRYQETHDRNLSDRANEMLTSIRTFVRAKRTVRTNVDPSRIETMTRNAYDAMVNNIVSFKRELLREVGEPQDEKPAN